MPRHLRIVRYLKGDNKYKESGVDGRTDTKASRLLLQQLEAEMADVSEFEPLSPAQIPRNRSPSISSIITSSSEESVTSDHLSSLRQLSISFPILTQRPANYSTPEPPTPEALTPLPRQSSISFLNLSERPTDYSTPEPPTPEALTPLPNRNFNQVGKTSKSVHWEKDLSRLSLTNSPKVATTLPSTITPITSSLTDTSPYFPIRNRPKRRQKALL